jgi:hypothetical protein
MDFMNIGQDRSSRFVGQEIMKRVSPIVSRALEEIRQGRIRVLLTMTLVLAAAIIPAVLAITLMGGGHSASPQRKATDLHSLPVSYHGKPTTWKRADFMYANQPGMVMSIDMRSPEHEQVVLFDTRAEHVKWLCQQGVQRQGC